MANKTVSVGISFDADISKAQAKIQTLQQSLNKVSSLTTTTNSSQLTTQISQASAAAQQLQMHLNNAFNANTGNLDLSLLDKSLKTSNSNLTTLSTSLLGAGKVGQQAFAQVAQAIAQADQPMLKISNKLQDFVVSLKNAAKYQLSNTIIQGFSSAINSAISYTKDLNSSLNDIRIVSGASADEMARFAEQANKAAKSLSSTTLDYSKAALIYYQQGNR